MGLGLWDVWSKVCLLSVFSASPSHLPAAGWAPAHSSCTHCSCLSQDKAGHGGSQLGPRALCEVLLPTWHLAALMSESQAGWPASLMELSFSPSLAEFPEGRRPCSPGHRGGKTSSSRINCIPGPRTPAGRTHCTWSRAPGTGPCLR